MKKSTIRRFMSLLLVAVLLNSLIACSSKTPDNVTSLNSGWTDDDLFDDEFDDVFDDDEFYEETSSMDSTESSESTGSSNNVTSSTPNKKPSSQSSTPWKDKFAPLVDDKSLGYNNCTLVGVDQFGRTFSTTAPKASDKAVGIFYFLNVGDVGTGKYYNVEEILKQPDGLRNMFFSASADYPDNAKYYWGESLWGYYKSEDEYVIRRHLELLTMAGIDYIAFDVTNAITYREVYMTILENIEKLVDEGWNPPRAVFYTHTKSIATVGQIYNDLYGRGLYKKAWYMVDGKPLIIGYTDPKKDNYGGGATPTPHSQDILDFFTWKNPVWPDENGADSNAIPWCDWTRDANGVPQQKLYGDYMCVQVASHPTAPYSLSVAHPEHYNSNWGRGFDYLTKTNNILNVDKGLFFQSQWDRALNSAAKNLFITGWNEWGAVKSKYGSEYMMVDTVNKEFSRDADLMKGGYGDAFYQQIISNIRAFKATSGKRYGSLKTIKMENGTSQWRSVSNVYRTIGTTNYGRDNEGGAGDNYYKQAAPRNNIQEVRVANDAKNLYFYIRCENDITKYDGKNNWMNLFIGTGTPSLKGWEGYEYVINRSPDTKTDQTKVYKLKSDFSGTESGTATYRVDGKVMQITVPRSAVGMANASSFYFKVADQVANPSDIMDYYVTGKSLPLGRLSHAYNIKK